MSGKVGQEDVQFTWDGGYGANVHLCLSEGRDPVPHEGSVQDSCVRYSKAAENDATGGLSECLGLHNSQSHHIAHSSTKDQHRS